MDVNIYSTKDYENQGRLRPAGKQTQTKPIQTQTKPMSKIKTCEESIKTDCEMSGIRVGK